MKAKISLGAIELIAETETEGKMLRVMLGENYKANNRITRPFGKDKDKYHFGALFLDKIAETKTTEILANSEHRYLKMRKHDAAD